MYRQSKKNRSGFTLLELLVVIGCISILTAVAVPSYALMQKNVSLSNYTQEITNALRTAQNLAISAQDGKNWGIHLETDKYILCHDDCSIANYTTTYSINNGVQILQGAGTEVIFNRLTGTTNTQTFVIGFSGGRTKTIQVDAVGKISITQ